MPLPQHSPMTKEVAIAATRDERIASVSRFIESRAKQFYRSLKPRERVNFDPDDVAQELWMTVAERDHKWLPGEGEYITFVGAIVTRALADIRDRSRTVESPRNSVCRMREYAENQTSSEERRRTAEDIKRTREGVHAISTDVSFDALDPCEAVERTWAAQGALRSAIPCLTITEASVVGYLYGIWNQSQFPGQQHSVVVTSMMLGCTPQEVAMARNRAFAKIRSRIADLGGDSTTEGERVPSWHSPTLYEKDMPDADDAI